MLIDFPPWLQTVLTLFGAVAIALLFGVIPRLAKARLKADPQDEWGLRLAMLGVFLKEASRSKLVRALPLHPLLRLALDSIPGSDPPAPTCSRTRGCLRIRDHFGACLTGDIPPPKDSEPTVVPRGEP